MLLIYRAAGFRLSVLLKIYSNWNLIMHANRLKTQTTGSGTVYFPTVIPNGIETSKVSLVDEGDQTVNPGTVEGAKTTVNISKLTPTTTTSTTAIGGSTTTFIEAGIPATPGITVQQTLTIATAIAGESHTIIRGSDLKAPMDITLNPNASETILYNGATDPFIRNKSSVGGQIGDELQMVCIVTGTWQVIHTIGTWTLGAT